MNKKIIGVALGAVLLALSFPAQAQQGRNAPRIAYLSASSLSSQAPRLEAFRRGLRELGYTEGKNITIDYRFAEGKLDRVPDLAAELVRLKVDIIVAPGWAAARAAKNTTTAIPIVIMGGGDPVAAGLVASLARPGGNVTGIVTLSSELTGKRLELLKESFPSVSRVALLTRAADTTTEGRVKETADAARSLGLKLQILEVRGADDFDKAFSAVAKGRAGALIELPNPLFHANRKRIVELAAKSKLPAIFHSRDFVDAGGLMCYGENSADSLRRLASHVDKILKGTKPADLSVEQPTKFELVINLKAAKQIGLTIPPNVLARADRVIR